MITKVHRCWKPSERMIGNLFWTKSDFIKIVLQVRSEKDPIYDLLLTLKCSVDEIDDINQEGLFEIISLYVELIAEKVSSDEQ